MQSVQESKQELEAAIRYAENAISSAKTTIESMEFRQEMAKKQYAEQTGLEKAQEEQIHKLMDESVKLKNEIAKLKKENVELEERNDELNIQVVELNNDKAVVEHEVFTLERDVRRLHDLGQGYYDDMMKFKAEVEFYTKEYNALVQRKDEAEAHVNALEQPERPTMPVIPKAVAIAIFREGVAHGVAAACTEIDNAPEICIEESEYCGGFEVSFSQDVDLSDHLDTDWMRDKCGDYSEQYVIDALGNLCADNEFECRIHGVDDQEEKNAD